MYRIFFIVPDNEFCRASRRVAPPVSPPTPPSLKPLLTLKPLLLLLLSVVGGLGSTRGSKDETGVFDSIDEGEGSDGEGRDEVNWRKVEVGEGLGSEDGEERGECVEDEKGEVDAMEDRVGEE